ncbi:LytR/AlgR family response regulator transcription factor [Rheinheimera tilapiae]|uniref:LytR/AlgR family response regulator transcription factor n=1 Tax=Rheinheimera tilapiae TaxID=875043 RepID=A0ABV6B7E0_9GAMM
MKAIVVEDSRLAREGLVRMLKDYPELTVVGQADHAGSALTLVNETHPDVIFLDIHMPGGTGFDLLEKLSYLPQIIFTTAYSEHAIRSFDFNTIDYLLKPISKERLTISVNKLLARTNTNNNDIDTEDETQSDNDKNQTVKDPLEEHSTLLVKDGDHCFLIRLDTIRYIESQKNYVQLFFENNKAFVKKSLNSIEARLPNSIFFRANRQYVVNLQEIRRIEESISDGFVVTMSDGKELEISRRNAIELKELLSF